MSSICDSIILLCRTRVTRLDTFGNPQGGSNNVYTDDSPVMLAIKPNVLAGEDKDNIGGCDCIVATYKGFDKLKRFDLEMDMSELKPALLEMLIGATLISSPSPYVGVSWPDQVGCDTTPQPNVCFEAWSNAWDDDHQDDTTPYIHWVWPSSYWQIGDMTLQNDFTQPKVNGFTRGNPNWGDGIFGDSPTVGSFGAVFYTDDIPDADCDYQTHSVS